MIISHDLKVIFIHVHRTGGTALTNILRQKSGHDFKVLSQHSNAKTVETSFFEKHPDYFTFGFTRNPWDRILSWYSLIHFKDQKSIAEERIRFEKFIESNSAADFSAQFFHYNSLDYFTNKEGEIIADKIFKYEHFQDEIRTLLNQFNIHLTEIPLVNQPLPKHYKDYYTDKSRSLIAQKCKKDIEYFNYSF